MVEYDVIIIGAGSIGVPTALATTSDGLKTLVIDSLPSVSQADNKHAIGGIRATHAQKSKIWLCQRSIEVFKNWEENFGDDIWWEQGGYCFVVYTKEHEQMLKSNIRLQKSYGLDIDYVNKEKIKNLIPGINDNNLLGGTYSSGDGNASPLLSLHAFYRQAKKYGADYRFNETVTDIITENGIISGLKTNKSKYYAAHIVNAAGSHANTIGKMINIDLPVIPESHEAGITEPVNKFFNPMVVDIRPAMDSAFGNSKNYYFYQNKEGKIIFCLTPEPSIIGTDRRETSSFLPQITKRMISLLPRLKNIKIRRTWRGLYPMTPDGNPILGTVEGINGYINAVGMSGQGFMLGPGIGELISRLIRAKLTLQDKEILKDFAFTRDYDKEENLK
ncbi:MAG: NAD(P)/FAD-dependent oxidoreductase [Promethearchaeota archaeon]